MRAHRRAGWVLLAAVCGVLPTRGAAQRPEPTEPDSATVAVLEELVVTADRAATPIMWSIGAVTRLERRALRAADFGGVGEALRAVPGFHLVDPDGSGIDLQPIVRGFYGGGESEYLVILLDGEPLNALQSGLMSWDLISPVAIEAVEVVRGPSSSLYGDAAVAGVVNLVSADADEPGAHVRLASGGHGLLRAGARASARVAGRRLAIHGSVLDGGGFRDHAERSTAEVGVAYDLASGARHEATVSLRSAWRDVERPGPLAGADLALGRTRSDAFYRFDETRERVHALGLRTTSRLSQQVSLSARVSAETRRTDEVRTLPLAPDFADTKARALSTGRIGTSAQVVWDHPVRPWPGRLVAGVDAARGGIDSEYAPVVTGPRAAYIAAGGANGPSDATGEGHRTTAAVFAQWELRPISAVRLSLGARHDWLVDRYTAGPPAPADPVEVTRAALSPEVGVSVRWLDRLASTGSVYLTAGRTFKAATPDQLFDQRSIPIPVPPFAATTSNPALVPQTGVNVEAGAYHAFLDGSGSLRASASVAVYTMDMEDELDFDIASLRYVNIGESRHRGVEVGVRVAGLGPADVHAAYALQSATSRSGEHAGRSLRAIPRHTSSGGVFIAATSALGITVDATRAAGTWLDSENTVRLPPHTRVDARASVALGIGSLFLEVRNALDARYSTTGFPDPSGSGTYYYYPAPGRTLGMGVALDW